MREYNQAFVMHATQNILHPTDFSPVSQAAFQVACAIAKANGGHLIVLHVQNMDGAIVTEFGRPPPDSGERAEARRQLEKVKSSPPMNIERVLNQGDPASQILAVARNAKCDLIVMGTHGHSPLRDLLMGSVATEVFRHAPCPVLTFRPRGAMSV